MDDSVSSDDLSFMEATVSKKEFKKQINFMKRAHKNQISNFMKTIQDLKKKSETQITQLIQKLAAANAKVKVIEGDDVEDKLKRPCSEAEYQFLKEENEKGKSDAVSIGKIIIHEQNRKIESLRLDYEKLVKSKESEVRKLVDEVSLLLPLREEKLAADEKIEKFTSEFGSLKNEFFNIKHELVEISNSKGYVMEERDFLAREVETLRLKIKDLLLKDVERKDLIRRGKVLGLDEIQVLKDNHDSEVLELKSEYQEQLERQKAELSSTEDKVNRTEKALEIMQVKNNSLFEELCKIKGKVGISRHKEESLREINEHLKTEIANVNKESKLLKSQNGLLKNEFKKCSDELEKLRSENSAEIREALEAEVLQLKETLELVKQPEELHVSIIRKREKEILDLKQAFEKEKEILSKDLEKERKKSKKLGKLIENMVKERQNFSRKIGEFFKVNKDTKEDRECVSAVPLVAEVDDSFNQSTCEKAVEGGPRGWHQRRKI